MYRAIYTSSVEVTKTRGKDLEQAVCFIIVSK